MASELQPWSHLPVERQREIEANYARFIAANEKQKARSKSATARRSHVKRQMLYARRHASIICVRRKARRAADPAVRLTDTLRARLRYALRKQDAVKVTRTLELTGCSIAFLREHLAKQFKPGMSWENHGKERGKWHVDHIFPCAAFDLRRIDHQRACFHYTNLQPLWGADNIRKSDRILNSDSFAKMRLTLS